MDIFQKLRETSKWYYPKILADYNYTWDVVLTESELGGKNPKHEPTICDSGEELPLVICRTALKLIGVEYESKRVNKRATRTKPRS